MNVPRNVHVKALKQQLANSGSLLDALDAAMNWRALVLLSATFVATVLVAAVFGAITAFVASSSLVLSSIVGLVSALVVGGIALVGINATGIMLADEVWERDPRGIIPSLLASALTSHRLVLILLIELALFLLYLVALSIVLFACKLPAVGPLLFALVFPVGAISTGMLIFVLFYIAIPLASPAVWNGVGVKRTLVMLKEVARTRLLQVVVMMVLLGLLIGFIAVIIWAALFSGSGVVISLSAMIVGVSAGGLDGIASLFMGGGGEGAGYIYAFGFGGAILALLGSTPGLLIGIKGVSIIYREVTADLSLDAAEEELDQQLEEVKRRAAEAKQRATAAQASPQPTPPAPVASACPKCGEPITPEDVFCGSCGHKLK
jgi:hypothetical protein